MERSELALLLDILRDMSGCDFVNCRCRKRSIAEQKFKFAYVARCRLCATWNEIARAVGWKNHTTGIHAVRQVEGFLALYPEWRRSVAEIEDELEFRMAVGLFASKD